MAVLNPEGWVDNPSAVHTCDALECDLNALCEVDILGFALPFCECLDGFSGDGKTCVADQPYGNGGVTDDGKQPGQPGQDGQGKQAGQGGQKPQVSNQKPQVSNQKPQVSNQMPQISNQKPQVSNQKLQISNQ